MKKAMNLLAVLLLIATSIHAQVAVSGDITTNTTWTASNTYLLKGFVRVKSGATLTIEPGTIIFGENSSQGSLIILPGGKINAQGTATKPIVFTSEFAKYGASRKPTYGDWGGIIILGNAPINVAGGTAKIEGPGDFYGGTNADDNSGVFSYVRIEYPGIAFSANNEINGLTMGGVGRGTKIDHVQVSYSGDDSFEWFGGNVNAKYLVAYRGWDDDFDTDFGFTGKLQYLFAIRDPQIADVSKSNGFESDNDGSGSANVPVTAPTWYNVTLVGPWANSGITASSNYGKGMHLRRNSQNKIHNTLIIGWKDGLYLDGTATIGAAANNNMKFVNSIVAGAFGKVADTTKSNGTFNPNSWFTESTNRSYATANEVKLIAPFSLSNPKLLPVSDSPVFSQALTPPNDGFFDVAGAHVGAFGTTDWTEGWVDYNAFGYTTDFTALTGDITGTLTLDAKKAYILKGFVRVKAGATLEIPAGTKIFGENTSQGSLIVLPGGVIKAEGTESNPIVFTSEFNRPGAARTPTYGDWGGIIILGNAPINVAGGTAKIEGPGDFYGGTNPDDSSGVMKYVRIEYPGIAFSANNEINGLTMGGVGRKTVIEHIQVSYSGDDSFEWFGGNVNAKYLIAYRGWDDDFDTDFGFTGKLQHLLAIRDPQIADVSKSNGFESDNDGSGSANTPVTAPTWYNVTLVGPWAHSGVTVSSNYGKGMHLRRNSQNKIYNTLIVGWKDGLYLDGTATIGAAANNNMMFSNSMVAGAFGKVADTTKSNGTFNPTAWFTAGNNQSSNDNATAKLYDAFNLVNPVVMPMVGSPLLTGAATPPADGFFDATNYIGAFGTTNWTAGWATFNPANLVDVDENGGNIDPVVTDYTLSQNYPNPFNPSTTINFALPEAGMVNLTVYNILGQQVASLVNDVRSAGSHSVTFNASNLSSGIYIYRLQAGNNVISRKMNLLK